MTLYDLILGHGGARSQLEEDEVEYYWSIEELTAYFNRAEREAVLRSYCLKYRHSSDIIGTANSGLAAKVADSICGISIVAGTAEYETSGKVIAIHRARLASQETPLEKKTRRQMDQIDPAWMDPAKPTGTPKYFVAELGHELILSPVPSANDTLYLVVSVLPRYDMPVPEYGSNIAFTALTKTITRSDGKFVTNGYSAGKKITISGGQNNGKVLTIASVASEGAMTVSEAILDDFTGSSIVISASPEIPEQYHYDLIDYACFLALKKRGKQTQDTKKALDHLALFTGIFGPKKIAGIEEAERTTPMEGGMMARKYRL